jgi:hypothetical protein
LTDALITLYCTQDHIRYIRYLPTSKARFLAPREPGFFHALSPSHFRSEQTMMTNTWPLAENSRSAAQTTPKSVKTGQNPTHFCHHQNLSQSRFVEAPASRGRQITGVLSFWRDFQKSRQNATAAMTSSCVVVAQNGPDKMHKTPPAAAPNSDASITSVQFKPRAVAHFEFRAADLFTISRGFGSRLSRHQTRQRRDRSGRKRIRQLGYPRDASANKKKTRLRQPVSNLQPRICTR